ncbi:hypothetical protein V6N13_105862 [Hibiscus sabdariffa]|uniref:Uncharacterized protein n=1 Tax=Hibiscus sabdariffa TaxID=183260 RepID=A0ABR2EYZ1_9ROSI
MPCEFLPAKFEAAAATPPPRLGFHFRGSFSLPIASPTFRTCHVLQRHACWYKNQSSASVKAEADKVRKGWPKLLLIMKWQNCAVESNP